MQTQSTPLLRCSRCGDHLPHDAFHRTNSRRGRHCYCKPCHREYGRERQARLSPEERYRRKKSQHLKSLYGITIGQYEAMAFRQGGVCAICGQPEPHFGSLAVDHDHTTGQVRGLLCGPCNMGVGQLGDDADRLERAAAYLRHHRQP